VHPTPSPNPRPPLPNPGSPAGDTPTWPRSAPNAPGIPRRSGARGTAVALPCRSDATSASQTPPRPPRMLGPGAIARRRLSCRPRPAPAAAEPPLPPGSRAFKEPRAPPPGPPPRASPRDEPRPRPLLQDQGPASLLPH
jgi:hypothetical protein